MRVLILVALCAATAFGNGTWEEQQAYAEEMTAEYLAACPKVRSDLFVVKTVELPDGSKLMLDLRIERPKIGGPFPVVFFVHGGGWITGSKTHFCHQSFELAKNGMAGVRLEYRWISQGAKYPEAIGDVLDAIDFIRQRAKELNLDFTRVGLAGGSAGGHLSAIAAQRTPECVCYDGYNGLFDAFDRGRSHFGEGDYTGTTEAQKKAASAIYNIKQLPPDTFLYHGTEDQTIDIDVARRFAEAIRKAGGNAELLVYEGVGHSFFGEEPYKTATTRALLAHTSYVFGLTDKKPVISDYALPPKIAEIPTGFSLVGRWKRQDGETAEFFEGGSVIYVSGQKLKWVERFGNLYVVWASGHYGRIDVSGPDAIKVGQEVFRKSGFNPAVTPAPRAPVNAWLSERYEQISADLKSRNLNAVEIVFIGDSITQGWLKEGNEFWEESFGSALNLGVSGDRTEHVLYRLIGKPDGGAFGHLDDPRIRPRTVVLMIGTNNLFKNSPDQIAEGIAAVCDRIQELVPQAEIILCSILPTSDVRRNRDLVIPVNAVLQKPTDVLWLDLYSRMTDESGFQRKAYFRDAVHLNSEGYRVWHESLISMMSKGGR